MVAQQAESILVVEAKPEMQIVFCSGYNPEMSGVVCSDDEVSHIVQKPFEPEKLLNIIRHALDEALCLVN